MSGPGAPADPWVWWPGRTGADLASAVAAWSASGALAALAAQYPATDGEAAGGAAGGSAGGSAGGAAGGDPLDRLAALAVRHWDLRRGRERHDLETGPGPLDALVLAAADELGLRGARPPLRRRYDWVLVLGGLVRACLVRPRHLQVLRGEGLVAGQVVALGGFRPLTGSEVPMAGQLGLTATDEFGCLLEGMRRALPPPGTPAVEEGEGWRVDRWVADGGTPVAVAAAPSGDPARGRATTADGYTFWLDRFRPAPGDTVLVITNPIYVPYQGCVAARLLGLGHGLAVETVGAGGPAGDLGGRTPGFSPRHYLQELGAAVTAVRALRDAAQQSGIVWSQSSAELSPL